MTKAEARFKRADRLYQSAIRLFFAFVFVMLVAIITQVATLQSDFAKSQTNELKRQETAREEARERLDKALSETNKQQVVTQNYIRCVAVISLLPIEERSAKKLDECGIPGVTEPKNLGNPNAAKSRPVATPAPAQEPTTSTNPSASTSGGAPPRGNGDTPPDDRSFLGKLPVIGGLFD